jgi:hypothetical protein
MKVTVSELRQVTNVLLRHLEETGHGEVELDADFYWNIPKERLYDPYVQPAKLTLGQLSDEWNELTRIAQGNVDPLNYDLVRLAAVLRWIGETSRG